MTEAILALLIASTLLLGSPGPATLSLAAVGGSWGVSRGLPYLAGLLAGLLCAMAGGVFGVAAVFVKWPQARWLVQLLGAAYLVYIAIRIATAPLLAAGASEQHGIPRLRDGVILNLLNPKAYAAFFVLFSQFLLPFDDLAVSYAVTAVIVFSAGVAVDTAWLAIGSTIRPVFTHPRSARATRVLFGVAIVAATLWSMF